MFRVDDDAVTRVGGVRARGLEALDAVRAPDQHGLPVAKLVESLEEVNATPGYPLYPCQLEWYRRWVNKQIRETSY